jgi:glycosyltransferase involved in cell wall biosynthesis
MNILLITTHLNYGGITSYIKSMGRGLKIRGHNVFIASSGGDCLGYLESLGIENILIPIRTKSEMSPKVLLSLLKLLPIIKRKNIQIIHSNTRVTQVLGFFLSKFSRIPYISTCHGFFKPKISRRLFGCWGKFVIAISESVKRHLIEDFGVKANRIKLIYHGIPIPNSQFPIPNSQLKERLGLKKGKIVGIVGRLSEVKGHTYLIHAFKMVKDEYSDVQLLIVGEGKIKPHLLKLVSELRMRDDVVFLSPVFDTSEVLSVMDIFCLPSLKEGLGLALMEAQALGIPVIATRVGGITSLIEDEKTGLLVKPENTEELSKAILRLLKDKDLARNLGERAREFIQENFSLEKMIHLTENVYKECLEEGS